MMEFQPDLEPPAAVPWRAARRAAGWLTAAHAAALLAAAAWSRTWSSGGPDLPSATLISLVVAQGCLVALFAGLGPAPFWLRAAAMLLGWAVISGLLQWGVDETGWPGFFVLVVLLCCGGASWAMRLMFGPLQVRAAPNEAEVPQFTLRHLMGFTTATAIAAALFANHSFDLGDEWRLVATVAACMGISVSACLWAMLGPASPWGGRILTVLGVSHVTGWLAAALVGHAAPFWIVMPTASTLVVAVSLGWLRGTGLRWTRTP